MKGILLAGGTGSRLDPITRVTSKQLVPIYDKPLIYYPLSTLMLAGMREVLVITTPADQSSFGRLLGDGRDFGLRISYAVQPRPDGIAQALVIGQDFLDGDDCALVLGDNLFHGHGLGARLRSAVRDVGLSETSSATVFATRVRDPERYGVVAFDRDGRACDLEEKPVKPRSDWAVTGLYLYDGEAPQLAAGLTPSARGELEITDLNRLYMQRGTLRVERLGRGDAWLDTGTPESLLEAATFVHALEARQGLKVCCPEEIALRLGLLTAAEFASVAATRGGAYGRYLMALVSSDDEAGSGSPV